MWSLEDPMEDEVREEDCCPCCGNSIADDLVTADDGVTVKCLNCGTVYILATDEEAL